MTARTMTAALVVGAMTAMAGMAVTEQAASAGETLDRVMKNGVLVNVTDQAYPPFSFMSDNNEMIGFDIDVAAEVAKRLGVKLQVETPSWEITTAGKWGGRYDVCICSMTPTAERAEVLDFISYYYGAPATIVVQKDDTSIKGAADLTGKMVGAQAGTTYERYLTKSLEIEVPGKPSPEAIKYPFGVLDVRPYQSETEAFQDLGLGAGVRLDAMVTGYLTAKERVEKDKIFKVVGEPLYQEPIYVSSDKGDAEFEAKIAGLIADMHKDGTLTAISMKWIGIDVTKEPK